MKKSQDSQSSQDVKPTVVTNDSKADLKNTNPAPDAGSISSNDSRKVSREDIELVQNLIERCLQLYMNRDEVVMTLLNRARIDPGFTTLVWQKLEEENADFFREYYIRLKLKKQIILFNQLLEHQCQMMKYSVPLPKVPLAPMQNGLQHPIAANNLPMGYPIMHHPPVAVPGQPHIDPMAYSAGCHVVNGVPAPGNFQPMRINPGNEAMMDASTSDVSPVVPPNHAMSSMPVSPTSVASSAPFPFSTSEISGMGVDTSVLDSAFTSDNGIGHSRESLRSLSQIPWNFSLSDLSADLGDLGALGNYPGSPFLPSDSDILLDSPEQDGIVEEFFVDSDPVPAESPPSDEAKS